MSNYNFPYLLFDFPCLLGLLRPARSILLKGTVVVVAFMACFLRAGFFESQSKSSVPFVGSSWGTFAEAAFCARYTSMMVGGGRQKSGSSQHGARRRRRHRRIREAAAAAAALNDIYQLMLISCGFARPERSRTPRRPPGAFLESF